MKRWEIFCAIPDGITIEEAQPILRDLARVTGGYTLLRGTGGWVDDGGKLVTDASFIVVTWGTNVESAIESACSRLRTKFAQDCVIAVATDISAVQHVYPSRKRE